MAVNIPDSYLPEEFRVEPTPENEAKLQAIREQLRAKFPTGTTFAKSAGETPAAAVPLPATRFSKKKGDENLAEIVAKLKQQHPDLAEEGNG